MNQDTDKKGKKVGADGLTKKERRALKVASEKKDVNVDTKPVQKAPTNISVAPKLTKETTPVIATENVSVKVKKVAVPELAEVSVTVSQPFSKNVGEKEKNNVTDKALVKAQRRIIQEEQRKAKAQQKAATITHNNIKKESIKLEKTVSNQLRVISRGPRIEVRHKIQLFDHLYYEGFNLINFKNFILRNGNVHPAFLQLGAQYMSKSILGSNARCLALLSALKCLITDFTAPPNKDFYRSLESAFQVCVAYIIKCRPIAVSMTNAVRHITLILTQNNSNELDSDEKKKANLLDKVDQYIQDDIGKAGKAISMKVSSKISDEDVILTYGYSSLIEKILVDAHKEQKRFKVVVLDARPLFEGKEMLRRLVFNGIQCSYLLINAASFVMSRITKVLLGAHALLANGYVMSRTGTAQVALVANAYKKPVLICCETYKFCERAQTDSFVYNEIGDPDALAVIKNFGNKTQLADWHKNNYLTPLNLMYDVTPSEFVTAVVTERAILPCTSVPVILRIDQLKCTNEICLKSLFYDNN
ncbi:hypothetical protein FQA39_LY02076 [Lamprigera yunnana]|nr:hypothetical protein FQA39_LY02076 [Lamprigera yunnana]